MRVLRLPDRTTLSKRVTKTKTRTQSRLTVTTSVTFERLHYGIALSASITWSPKSAAGAILSVCRARWEGGGLRQTCKARMTPWSGYLRSHAHRRQTCGAETHKADIWGRDTQGRHTRQAYHGAQTTAVCMMMRHSMYDDVT